MAELDVLKIQELLNNLDEEQVADLLMQQHPEIDSTKIVASMDEEQQQQAQFFEVLSGVQSGQQPAGQQPPTAQLFGFGRQQPFAGPLQEPGPPQGFGELMFGRKRNG